MNETARQVMLGVWAGLRPDDYASWKEGQGREKEREARIERDKQEGKLRGLEIERAQRINDATSQLNERYTVGMRNMPAIQAKDADFEAALTASAKGLPLPAYNQETWNAPDFRKATERELLQARRGLFAAAGNADGLRLADREERGLNVQDRFKALSEQADKDPTSVVALARRLNLDGAVPLTVETPTDPKTGRLTGLARINLVKANGDIKPIEVKGRSLQELMLATSYIEEGDVESLEKGLQILGAIDKDLADRVRETNKQNLDLAQAHNNAYGTQEQVRQGNARLTMQREELNNARRGRPIQLVNAKTNEAALFYEGELGVDKQGMVMLPPGWMFPKTRETQFIKSEGGGGVVVDMRNNPLFGVTPQGAKVPVGVDAWADPKSGANERERWEKQNVARVTFEDPSTGALSWRFIDATMDPYSQVPETSPQAVVDARNRRLAEVGARRPPVEAPRQGGLRDNAPPPRAAGMPNPYVDGSGRPVASAQAGAPSLMAGTVVPGVASAASAAGAYLDGAALRYLQSKIQRGEQLTPAEMVRARQNGLVR